MRSAFRKSESLERSGTLGFQRKSPKLIINYSIHKPRLGDPIQSLTDATTSKVLL